MELPGEKRPSSKLPPLDDVGSLAEHDEEALGGGRGAPEDRNAHLDALAGETWRRRRRFGMARLYRSIMIHRPGRIVGEETTPRVAVALLMPPPPGISPVVDWITFHVRELAATTAYDLERVNLQLLSN